MYLFTPTMVAPVQNSCGGVKRALAFATNLEQSLPLPLYWGMSDRTRVTAAVQRTRSMCRLGNIKS